MRLLQRQMWYHRRIQQLAGCRVRTAGPSQLSDHLCHQPSPTLQLLSYQSQTVAIRPSLVNTWDSPLPEAFCCFCHQGGRSDHIFTKAPRSGRGAVFPPLLPCFLIKKFYCCPLEAKAKQFQIVKSEYHRQLHCSGSACHLKDSRQA